jgi:uncharacterized Fe-S cluster-containing MiaB family protein
MERYSIITNKNPREIVLLRGSGCKWKKCTFCDYHLDFSLNEDENFKINSEALSKVKGLYGRLEAINSGSFCDLDDKTIRLIIDTCIKNKISIVHFECHYIHRAEVASIKRLFADNGITVKIKTGVETFDVNYREKVLKKGFGFATPMELANYADEVCLLFGLTGQTEQSMINDIETGLKYFDRVCVNIMTPNTTDVQPDKYVIQIFQSNISEKYIDNNRVDILFENTDFGVGS